MRCSWQWQRYDEFATCVVTRTVDAYGTVVQVYDGAHQRQAYPQAAQRWRFRAWALHEQIKDERLNVKRHPRTVINHGDVYFVLTGRDSYDKATEFGSIFAGIEKQIRKYLGQSYYIAVDKYRLR